MTQSELLLRIGIIAVAITAVLAVMAAVLLVWWRKRLLAKLEAEYGERLQ